MAGETIVTVCGNLVDDPELRFTSSGAAVAKFRVASTPRKFDRNSNAWVDDKDGGLFLTCSVWRQAAENVAESLQRGMRVIVQGRLRQRSYEDREGVKRTVYELDVEEVGASLRNATAKVTKAGGSGSGKQEAYRAAQSASSREGMDDPWGSGVPGTAPAAGGWDDSPPF